MKDYYEQLYASKLVNLEEINKFLETYHLPGLNHEEIEHLSRQITNKEIKLSNQKSPNKEKFRTRGLSEF